MQTSQIHTVPSPEVEAIRSPLGLQATQYIAPVCPVRVTCRCACRLIVVGDTVRVGVSHILHLVPLLLSLLASANYRKRLRMRVPGIRNNPVSDDDVVCSCVRGAVKSFIKATWYVFTVVFSPSSLLWEVVRCELPCCSSASREAILLVCARMSLFKFKSAASTFPRQILRL